MVENSDLKKRLQAVAESVRGDSSEEAQRRLQELQEFFVQSLGREIDMGKRGTDFAAMSSQEDAARDS